MTSASFLRYDFSFEFFNPQLLGHGLRGGGAVAGKHHKVHALAPQIPHSLKSRGLDRIGDADHSCGLSIYRSKN